MIRVRETSAQAFGQSDCGDDVSTRTTNYWPTFSLRFYSEMFFQMQAVIYLHYKIGVGVNRIWRCT